jgi:hypothetical protein
MIQRISIIVLLGTVLAACVPAKPTMLPPWRQQQAAQGINGASAMFNAGWRDGCESGSVTSATQLQRLFHGFKMNEQLITNDEYYNGWNKAFRYCHRYAYQYHRKDFSD